MLPQTTQRLKDQFINNLQKIYPNLAHSAVYLHIFEYFMLKNFYSKLCRVEKPLYLKLEFSLQYGYHYPDPSP